MVKSLTKKVIHKLIHQAGYRLIPFDKNKLLSSSPPFKTAPLNIVIGGGERSYGSNWHNIEYVTAGYIDKYQNLPKHVDINHDLTSQKPLPVEPLSIERIFTSHVIEHLKEEHTQFIFNEAYRALKKGGIFRISCPDIDLYLRAFINQDLDFFHYRDHPHYKKWGIENSITGLFIDVFATGELTQKISSTQMQDMIKAHGAEKALDTICQQVTYNPSTSHYHVSWYNFNKLKDMLSLAGFTHISRCALGQSADPELRDLSRFDTGDPKISLFVECKKT